VCPVQVTAVLIDIGTPAGTWLFWLGSHEELIGRYRSHQLVASRPLLLLLGIWREMTGYD